jgi:hypothetical protein
MNLRFELWVHGHSHRQQQTPIISNAELLGAVPEVLLDAWT